MEIAIFGAGIAGLMTALALRTEGYRCRIYERLRDGYESGMGFILMPGAIACLENFGVHMKGASLHRYFCRDEEGQILHEEAMPAGARAIKRRELTTALADALPQNNTLIFDAELSGFEFNEDGSVTSAYVNSPEGTLQIKADLYIGADGHRSRARRAIFPNWPESPAQVFEIVGLARCYNTSNWTGGDFNKFHGHTGGLALGVVPVDEDHVVWYLQFDTRRFPLADEFVFGDASANANPRREFVEKLAGHWADPVRHLIAITDFTRVHVWRPIDANLVPHFHQRNLALIGDAAHPLLPFTSQGVSAAIADAVALAKNLTAYRLNSSQGCLERNIPQALAAYSRERREQCMPYVAKGRELTGHFLSRRVASHTWLPLAQ